jgi:hypothetical protein
MTNPLMELERALADIRLSPEPLDVRMNELVQQYETVLTLLESQFLGALLSGDWSEFDQFVSDFRTPCILTQTTITEAVEGEQISTADGSAIAHSQNHRPVEERWSDDSTAY